MIEKQIANALSNILTRSRGGTWEDSCKSLTQQIHVLIDLLLSEEKSNAPDS